MRIPLAARCVIAYVLMSSLTGLGCWRVGGTFVAAMLYAFGWWGILAGAMLVAFWLLDGIYSV